MSSLSSPRSLGALFRGAVLLTMVLAPGIVIAQAGSIAGTVVDGDFGGGLPGATVYIEVLQAGAATDIDGNYSIEDIPVGTYDVRFSYTGYGTQTVQNVAVADGEATQINVTLMPGQELDEVVVEAEEIIAMNSEAGLLRVRAKAAQVSDAISAEAISRSGSDNAADAIGRVTGASVVGGRYVYVRGLGDRYVNTQLNGATLPSSDPNRNAVPLDLFPSDLLDNIVTSKTFTPDQPGNFAGGSVNINTKGFPEALTIRFSSSTGYNSLATFKDAPSARGGGLDWLGFDDGSRNVPDLWAGDARVPAVSRVRFNADSAAVFERLASAFNPDLAPVRAEVPVNQSVAFSIGNQTALFGRPLGFIGSLSYSLDHAAYIGGTTGQYVLRGAVAENDSLDVNYLLNDSRGTEEVLWGGLGSLSYRPHPNHEVSTSLLYNRSGIAEARDQVGINPKDFATTSRFLETRTLGWTQRSLGSVQGQGEHFFPALRDLRAEWTASYAVTRQDEPDLRFFANDYTFVRDAAGAVVDTSYNITPSNYTLPSRYFRDLEEGTLDTRLGLAVPLAASGPFSGTLRFGGAFAQTDRAFRERLFQYVAQAPYDGDPQAYFSDRMTGIVDTVDTVFGREYVLGNYVQDRSSERNNYDGDQAVTAAFVMAELRPLPRVRAIVGARFEATRQSVVSQDTTTLVNPITGAPTDGEISQNDLLPSVNLVYEVRDDMNLRAAYGRTLARPTFRELAPFSAFEFIGDYVVNGNPDLERTLIDNVDLRWEWFTRPGEILALSAFYKGFQNPIERAILSNNNQVQFQNVPSADVFGLEFEARRRFDRLPVAGAVEVGGNLTLTESAVDVPEREQQVIRQFDPALAELSLSRPLQGQSPFVANLDVTYGNERGGTSATILYNVYGRRLANVSLGGTPNEYEFTTGVLDLTFRQRLGLGISLSASASNVLAQDATFGYTYRGVDYVTRQYERGRSFSVGLSYRID